MNKETQAEIVGERPKDRHSRMNMRNKYGLKKGGAGGKGTWGKPGCELIPVTIDVNDPAYDSEDDTNIVFYQAQKDENETPKSGITLKQYKDHFDSLIEEYFTCQDIEELRDCLNDLDCIHYHYELIKRAITRAMDFGPRECELVSEMICALIGDEFSIHDVTKAFDKVLSRLDDLKLDVPNAEDYVSKFIARAVADEVLPPSVLVDPVWLKDFPNVLKLAGDLLNLKHGLARMEKIWGTGSIVSIEEFKMEVKQAIQEYFMSLDIDECLHCIMDINQPFFGHEFVYRSIVLGMDGDEKQIQLVEALLNEAIIRKVLLYSQLLIGLKRVQSSLNDICLDVPNGHAIFDTLLTSFNEKNLISEENILDIKLQKN